MEWKKGPEFCTVLVFQKSLIRFCKKTKKKFDDCYLRSSLFFFLLNKSLEFSLSPNRTEICKKLTVCALAASAVIWNFPSTQRQITCWGCVQKPWNRESKDLQRESSNRSTVWSEPNLESFQNLNFILDIKSKNVAPGTYSKNNKPSPLNSPHQRRQRIKLFLKYAKTYENIALGKKTEN